MIFKFKVNEKRVYRMLYTVEADDEEDARVMAEMGDTDDEEEVECEGVIDRQIVEA